LQRETVAVHAEARHHRLGDVRKVGVVAEGLALVDVGQVDLEGGQPGGGGEVFSPAGTNPWSVVRQDQIPPN